MLDIRGIIFDLDGVIADSHSLHEASWNLLLAEEKCTLTPSDIARAIRGGKTRAEMLRHFFPRKSQDARDLLGNRKEELFRNAMPALQPIPGVVEWIRQLAGEGMPLAVATSASRPRTLATLEQFGIEKLFRSIVSSSDVLAGKPDPTLFQNAARTLGQKPGHLLVVEDSEAGLAAAHAAGMLCLFYAPLSEPAPRLARRPEFQISAFTPEQLQPLMRWLPMMSHASERA